MANTKETGQQGLSGQTLVGRFAVREVIAETRYSVIYRGLHVDREQPVIVERFKLPPVDAVIIAAFAKQFREDHKDYARITQEDPRFARSVGSGSALTVDSSRFFFMVSEWLAGPSLATRFMQRSQAGDSPWTLAETIELLSPCVEAIARLHDVGLVHGSVSPENLFFEREDATGGLKWYHVGTADLVPRVWREVSPDVPCAPILSLEYGLPEQFYPKLGRYSPASDVYGIALLVGACLRHGFAKGRARGLGELAKLALDPHARPTPRQLGVAVGDATEEVFARAVGLDPSQRWPHARLLWDALKEALDKDSPRKRAPKITTMAPPATEELDEGWTLSTPIVPTESLAPPMPPPISRAPDPEHTPPEGTEITRAASSWPEGAVFEGKYRVERVLHANVASTVLLAHHGAMRQRVVIKILTPGAGTMQEADGGARFGDDKEREQRFRHDAGLARWLDSPYLVSIVDVGVHASSGAPFIVTEYLEGVDLAQAMRKKSYPLEFALDCVLQACAGLVKAHRLNIAHGTMKPSNVFLVPTKKGVPSVRVLDFGLSRIAAGARVGATEVRLLASDVTPAAKKVLIDSLRYLAPELLHPVPWVDARSDVYGLGAILYELIAGQPAIARGGELTDMEVRVLRDRPIPLSDHRKDIDPGLEQVIMRCLEKRPEDRHGSILDLVEALAPFALGGAHPLVEPIRRWAPASAGAIPIVATPSKRPAPIVSFPPVEEPKPQTLRSFRAASDALRKDYRARPRAYHRYLLVGIAMLTVGGALLSRLW